MISTDKMHNIELVLASFAIRNFLLVYFTNYIYL